MSSLACFLSRNRSPLSGHSDVCSPGLLLLIVTIFLMHHFKCTSNETKYEEEPLRFLKRSLLHVSTKGYSNAGPRLDSFLYLSLGVRTIMTSSWISPSTKSAPTVSIFVGKLRNLQTRPETPAHSTTHLKKKKKKLACNIPARLPHRNICGIIWSEFDTVSASTPPRLQRLSHFAASDA